HVKIQNYHNEDGSDYDLLVKLPSKKEDASDNIVIDKIKNTINAGAKIKKHFISNKSTLLVPIKLFLSLPIVLDEGLPNKVSQKQLLPDLLTTNNLSRVEVLTSGGIEHNRPLMHLINAHRMQRKDKRVFGFLDNHFDFNHRWENDAKPGFDHLFIMGIAQPVSGFNQILIKRVDEEGISSSLEAKHIAFSVKCPKTKKEIVTISSYGFSALASVYATLRLITKLVRTIQLEDILKSDILIKGVIDNMEGEWVDLEAGYSWRVVFSKDTEKKLYEVSNDIDPFSVVTSPNFPKEAKELIRIFSTNERDPNENGVIDKIHPARALTSHS
ncbi:MAG: hypothetical protein KAH22_01225, partial [Thiotrichaceae bacterium]|nr:hypothetical protein [Thiotrichaceae bacterium]